MDTTLILTPPEAEMFKKYMQHHELFLTMEAVGAFDVKFGKIIFNCANGQIQNIVLEQVAWKK